MNTKEFEISFFRQICENRENQKGECYPWPQANRKLFGNKQTTKQLP